MFEARIAGRVWAIPANENIMGHRAKQVQVFASFIKKKRTKGQAKSDKRKNYKAESGGAAIIKKKRTKGQAKSDKRKNYKAESGGAAIIKKKRKHDLGKLN